LCYPQAVRSPSRDLPACSKVLEKYNHCQYLIIKWDHVEYFCWFCRWKIRIYNRTITTIVIVLSKKIGNNIWQRLLERVSYDDGWKCFDSVNTANEETWCFRLTFVRHVRYIVSDVNENCSAVMISYKYFL